MKKIFLSIVSVAVLGLGVIAVSCGKDDNGKSDTDRGKEDGAVYCECTADKTKLITDTKCIELVNALANYEEKTDISFGNVVYWAAFYSEKDKCSGE